MMIWVFLGLAILFTAAAGFILGKFGDKDFADFMVPFCLAFGTICFGLFFAAGIVVLVITIGFGR